MAAELRIAETHKSGPGNRIAFCGFLATVRYFSATDYDHSVDVMLKNNRWSGVILYRGTTAE